MIWSLRILFILIFVVMVYSTTSASLQCSILPPLKSSPVSSPTRYDDFARNFSAKLEAMRKQVLEFRAAKKTMAVWGAAAKGSTFLNQLSLVPEIVSTVIDINPRKQGKYVAGTGQLICAPEHLQSHPCDVVFIMNPNYQNEIRQQLQELNLKPELIVI